jgi:hypothetical protein
MPKEEAVYSEYLEYVASGGDLRGDVDLDWLITSYSTIAHGNPRRRGLRSRIVVRAITNIRAKVGFMEETPANRLVVSREFRKWAGDDGVGMRPTHIDHFTPHVVAFYFLKTAEEREISQMKQSHAYARATNTRLRKPIPLLGWFSGTTSAVETPY